MAEMIRHIPPTTCQDNGVSGCSSRNHTANSSSSSSIAGHVNTSCTDKENTALAGRRTANGSHVNGSGDSPTHELPQALPKLPVPDLQSTMNKYLTLIQTVVSPQEFARTKFIVTEFCKPHGVGQQIQEYLLKRQQAKDNWAADWWLNDMYLNVRLPLIINSNPAAVFQYQRFTSLSHQIRFSARFIRGILDFKRLLDTRTLPVERCKYREKGQPLCMEQHYRLFSCYREPGIERDILRTDMGSPGKDYIVVARHNQFFKVSVQQGGENISEADLCSQLSRVLKMAEERNQAQEVGILTSQARHTWAEHRARLMQDATNRASLQVIENCIFLLCLDKVTAPSCAYNGDPVASMTARMHHIIHGSGSDTANRWMDKTIQLIVSEDGTCGINIEHSVAEGIALGHMIEHAFSSMAQTTTCNGGVGFGPEQGSLDHPVRLEWNLSSHSMSDIQTARESVESLIDDFDLVVFKFEDYGREFIKKQNMSPDAYIQLALQLTYYKIHGVLTSTYESAAVRRYRQGRVDVIRANSPAALSWIRAMLGQTDKTVEEKRSLFLEAVKWQQDYTLDTILGYGIDLHMLGLREAAEEMGIPTPDIFKDPSYKELITFRLSTSQVVTVSDYWMGYGAVVPDGYGCCYNPQPDYIIFSVASFYSCPDTSSDMFANTLESSLLQMAEMCTQGPDNVNLVEK